MADVEPIYARIWKDTGKVREINANFIRKKFKLPNMSEARLKAKDTTIDRLVRIVRAIASEHRPSRIDPMVCGGCGEPYPCPETQLIISILEGNVNEQRGRDQQSA